MMAINPLDGSIESFVSLEYDDWWITPFYDIGGAIYNDVSDYRDGQNYLYTSFNANDEMHVMRVLNNPEDPQIDWHFAIPDVPETEDSEEKIRRKDSSFIHADP